MEEPEQIENNLYEIKIEVEAYKDETRTFITRISTADQIDLDKFSFFDND